MLHVRDLDKCGVLVKNVSGQTRFKYLAWSAVPPNRAGVHQRAHLVPETARGRHDVRPRGNHHVQAAGARGHFEEGGVLRREAVRDPKRNCERAASCSHLLRRLRLSRPPAARISGVVEESPGKLEYEVALFRESGSGGVNGDGGGVGGGGGEAQAVEQAVPIGTKLQLRATIGADSGA